MQGRLPTLLTSSSSTWLWTNIAETINKFLLNLAVKSIPQTHFSVTECDHCANDVSDPSSNLKCMWVWESGIAEVGMLARIDGIAVNGLVNRSLVSHNDLDKPEICRVSSATLYTTIMIELRSTRQL